jgi:hypothetical protein
MQMKVDLQRRMLSEWVGEWVGERIGNACDCEVDEETKVAGLGSNKPIFNSYQTN